MMDTGQDGFVLLPASTPQLKPGRVPWFAAVAPAAASAALAAAARTPTQRGPAAPSFPIINLRTPRLQVSTARVLASSTRCEWLQVGTARELASILGLAAVFAAWRETPG